SLSASLWAGPRSLARSRHGSRTSSRVRCRSARWPWRWASPRAASCGSRRRWRPAEGQTPSARQGHGALPHRVIILGCRRHYREWCADVTASESMRALAMTKTITVLVGSTFALLLAVGLAIGWDEP